jgi:class 3 adenylate cyclase
VRGDLEGSLDSALAAIRSHERLGYRKMAWRARVQAAEVLAELGRNAEAEEMLPSVESRTELQDIVYDAGARIRVARVIGRFEGALPVAEEIHRESEGLGFYRETLALAAEVFAGVGRVDEIEELAETGRAHPTTAGTGYLDEIEGRIALERGEPEPAAESFRSLVREAEGAVADSAAKHRARLIIREAGELADELGIELPAAPEEPAVEVKGRTVVPQGERLVTSLFADVRGYSELGSSLAPGALAERVAMLYRLARVAVERRQGIVDKFAGDAVMATYDIFAVTGEATNLAARLQAQAGPGEVLLSAEAHRRVADWLADHDLQATEEELELKGFAGPQVVYRLAAGDRAAVA